MMRTFWTLALCVGFVACGPAKGDDTNQDDTLATLTIEPEMSEHEITPTMAASQVFTATVTYPGGQTRDVTSEVAFGVDSLGGFNMNTLSISGAGKATVFAVWGDPAAPKTASAQVIARMKSSRVDPSLPPNTPDLFNGPDDPSRAPTILYPPVGTIIPRNLGDFEAHWTDGSGNTVFELSLHTEFTDVRIYVPGGNGLPVGPMPTWGAFLATEWIAATQNEKSVQFQVRGVDAANPVAVGSTPPQLVKLSNESMEGGIYYWGIHDVVPPANYQVSGVYRHDMSKPGLPAEEYMTNNQTIDASYPSGRCVACHSLSRDGTKMALTYDGGNGQGTMVDVATGTRQAPGGAWNFATFTPDGSQVMTVLDRALTVRDTATQAALVTAPFSVNQPDLSADGKTLVYMSSASGSDPFASAGQIHIASYDQATQTFGAPIALVTDGVNNFYPTFSPDGQWVLFNRADDGGDSYDNPNAQLWVVKADGSAPPMALATGNLALGLTNSWGRWAPFAQSVGPNFDPVFWITVSSKRDFGVRRLLSENRPQIWMMPFFPSRAGTGQDPSGPGFHLPFQNIDTRNHIAQWTERIVVTQ
ncbi:MAG: PD40 domain-containing protein [Deltaproteobacteria bacterium]|nr:PD40 domain-containing protein [Deltaproteobacteria bacterium]